MGLCDCQSGAGDALVASLSSFEGVSYAMDDKDDDAQELVSAH